MIRERKVKKYYCALVKGKIQPGKYEAYISKDDELNKSTVYDTERPDTKKIKWMLRFYKLMAPFHY